MAAAFAIVFTGMLWLGSLSGNSFALRMGWLAIPFAETILLLTGIKLIYGAIRVKPEQKSYKLAKNGELIAVAFAAGLNAFMIGLGFGLLRPVAELTWYIVPAGIILFAYTGDFLGKRNGRMFYTRLTGTIAGLSVIFLGLMLILDFYEFV